MKKLILIVSIVLCGITVLNAQEGCDTLKIKVIDTDYYKYIKGDITGKLDGVEINMDTLPVIYFAVEIVNVSRDTFFKMDTIQFHIGYYIYYIYDNDTARDLYVSQKRFYFSHDFLPDDTLFVYLDTPFNIPDILSDIKQQDPLITMLNRTRCDVMTTVLYSSKDGYYSDSIFLVGSDTAIFYITGNEVGIKNLLTKQKDISIFPNPAQSQLTVTNTQGAILRLYNVLGQEVINIRGEGENAIINTSHLPQGLYVLKVEKENAILTRKVHITR
jgi:hypothetical protein